MHRREFLAGTAATLAAAPRFGWAQERVPRLAYVGAAGSVERMTAAGGSARSEAFHREIRRLGYIEGENLTIEYWTGAGRDGDGFASFAREIVASKPDLITSNTYRLVAALKRATNKIPIVFIATDPIGNGLVTNLAHPGGNLTGFSTGPGVGFEGKRLEMLHRMAPSAKRFAYLAPQSVWDNDPIARAARDGADQLGIELIPAILDSPIGPEAYERAFTAMADADIEAVLTSNITENYSSHSDEIIRLAKAAWLPTIYLNRSSVIEGGLMTYSTDIGDIGSKMAGYVDRILRGDKPGDLPVQQPTKFDFIINLKTADALGITVPPALMIFATEFVD